MHNPQLNKNGELAHLLSIEGLPKAILNQILDTAESFMEVSAREVKKVPLLRGKSVFNLFFENSTRTRTTFEIAAKRLSADVINLDINKSSTAKGETLLDTIDNLCAMHANLFVVRHASSGAPYLIAEHLQRTGRDDIHVVNAGDGRHAHPTQGLLDMYTIRHYKKDFTQLRVAIVGDILHSRVARSDIHALNVLGAGEVRAVGPQTLLPTDIERMGDHASDIAEIIPHLVTVRKEGDPAVSQAIAMGRKAYQMILDAMDALTAEDEIAARRVIAADDAVDYDFNAIKHTLAQEIAADPAKVDAALDLLMVIKYLERIGDHAVNVAEWVQFVRTGRYKDESMF